jgi:hypothetical protein
VRGFGNVSCNFDLDSGMFAEVYGLFVLHFGHGKCLIRFCLYYDMVLG